MQSLKETAFNVSVTADTADHAVVSVSGDLDLLGATKLHRPLSDALSRPVAVLDLSACEFCDSSGLRTILVGLQRARGTGHALRIAGAGKAVVRVFETAGLLTELDLYPSVPDALAG
jgi:anti-sigma B factor antagonist